MGLFDFLFGSSDSSSDPKTRVTISDDDKMTVRNTDIIYEKSSGKHDTVFSKTTVDLKTGDTNYEEGAHGPNYNK